jgi:hypothetical protein
MMILMRRRSQAFKGPGGNAPRVLRRTAELIPNRLKFSALPTLHPGALTRRSRLGQPFEGSLRDRIN